MDTNRLKRFATEARKMIRDGVARKLLNLGFDMKGEAELFPQKLQGVTLYRGQQWEESFYDKWMALYEAIQKHGVNEVCEEVAYTWFNRLVAIRILQMNGFIDRVLLFDNPDIRVPHIVSEARQGRFPKMGDGDRIRLRGLLGDPGKTYEQFALLITAFCHATPILQRCFGSINDYTELLLPEDILDEDKFVDKLNKTDFISEEDYKTTELLGWLYQFYIAERKADVFASFKSGHKAEADDIAPATQIFTPNWIVKYMVQNTLGRIYLDNNPHAELEGKMSYLVPQSDSALKDSSHIYTYSALEDLKVIDPACGSGHILLEAFDLLFDMYIDEYYSRREAIENIFAHNLVGIDLDTRAKQLATFALLLKACQKDDSFLTAEVMPRVMDVPKPHGLDKIALRQACLDFIGGYEDVAAEELAGNIEDMKDMDTLGSIMRFPLDDMRPMIATCYEQWMEDGLEDCPENVRSILPYVQVILALTDKYTCVIANPPYMGAGNMNSTLSEYVKTYYAEGKADLFSVFMMMGMERLQANGKMAQINMQSWMFLSSFEKLRNSFLQDYCIDNMLHLGAHTFDELSGEVVQNTAFVLTNPHYSKYGEMTDAELAALPKEERMAIVDKLIEEVDNGSFKKSIQEAKGTYYRLVDGKNCTDKEQLFLSHIHGNEDGNRIYYPNVEQKNFKELTGSPLGYWISPTMYNTIANNPSIGELSEPRAGLQTSDNNRFLRIWSEVSFEKIGLNLDRDIALKSDFKWFPHNKGGHDRRWYGNRDYIINFKNDGEELKYWLEHNPNDPTTKSWSRNLRNYPLYFKRGVTWSAVSSKNITVRYSPTGCLFDTSGPMLFSENNIDYFLGFMNSNVLLKFARLFAQGLSIGSGHIARVPFIINENSQISILVKENVKLAKEDWDTHETSWDFQQNELLSIGEDTNIDNIQNSIEKDYKETGIRLCVEPAAPRLESLEWRIEEYKQKWEHKFMQLHANEEELNKQFIDIYGLQDELTPDVPLDEVTILQQGEKTIEDNKIVWHDDVLVKQLISYAIGCIMGRYSIDRKGLILANQGDGIEEYHQLVPESRFEPDDDGIVPLLGENSPFSDNAVSRISELIKVVFGSETQTENLNYIEATLGKSLSDYLQKDFWKDHKKMYQKRPIYWLFASKKGAFQCLVYMHRMDAYVVGKVRTKYLLPYIEWLKAKIEELMVRQAELTSLERRQLRDYNKWLDECREYDVRLHEVANQQISIDLDDGVVVNYAKYGDVLAKLK